MCFLYLNVLLSKIILSVTYASDVVGHDDVITQKAPGLGRCWVDIDSKL